MKQVMIITKRISFLNTAAGVLRHGQGDRGNRLVIFIFVNLFVINETGPFYSG